MHYDRGKDGTVADRDMPVWGERFGEIVGHDVLGEAVIRSHLRLLIAYLQTIQQ